MTELNLAIAGATGWTAGGSAAPYVNGVLLGVRRARGNVGLLRGLDPCSSPDIPERARGALERLRRTKGGQRLSAGYPFGTQTPMISR